MSDELSLIQYVNDARVAGYTGQQIVDAVESTGDVAFSSYVGNIVQQLEFQDKLCRYTIRYDREFLYQSLYNAVISRMNNDDIIRICADYCNLDDYAFCQLALQHILENRVPSEAEIANFLRIAKLKFNESIDSIFKLIDDTVNIHFLRLIRKAFVEWHLYPAFVEGKDIDYFLSLANKCNDGVIIEYCRRTADKISIQLYGQRLSLLPQTNLLIGGVNNIPKSIQSEDAIEEIYNNQPTIDESGELLVQVLSDFNIKAELVNSVSGPTFNRIEVKLGRGVKFSSVANFSDDLMQQLGDELGIDRPPMVSSIRGRTAFDIPKLNRAIAYFRDYVDFNSDIDIERICIPAGIDVNGKYFEINFCDDNSPHMMGGGRTRSGKSQFLKSGVMFLARRYPPSLVRLMLSDVKRVTLGKFKNLPHLIGSVCKDASSTADMLEYLTAEMELRYQEFERWEDSGIENINQYNKLHCDTRVMPHIVCWIDEISELISDVAYCDRIEKALASLLRKAGAAGIHINAYTQRPDKDSLKPQIRSNFPAKVAFAVARPEDSFIILGDPKDARAMQLLGRGDFILRTPEVDERLQALYLDDADDTEYFSQLMEEAILQDDPYVEWESGLSFDEFIEQLHLNKDTVDPNAVDRVVTKRRSVIESKDGGKGDKKDFKSSFEFNIELDAFSKDAILSLWRRGYSSEQIVTELFGAGSGRDEERRFNKQKKVVDVYISSLDSDEELE